MKVNRKIFAILISITIIAVSVISVSAYPAYDVSEEIRSGDYDYYILNDDTVRLSAYYGADENLIIPEIIDGHNVSAIGRSGAQWFFNNLDPNGNDFRKVKSIELPKTLTWFLHNSSISCFGNWSTIENIYVDEENPNFKSDNGIFYNKDISKLLFYPEGKKDIEYVVPESVTAIEYGSINDNRYVEKIYLGKQISSIADYSFSNCTNVTLHVYDNSYALEWAKSHDFPYEIIEEKEEIITNDENGIPDNALYNYILSISDSNNDGIIQRSEVEDITKIYYDGYDNCAMISTLIGLNYLYNLKEICIVNNNISTLDGIQGLNLKKIFVYYNQLVDISAISEMASTLEVLEVSHNKLSKLPDMTNFYKLQYNEWSFYYQTTNFAENKLTYNELYYNLPTQLVEFKSDEYNLIDVWASEQSPDEVPLPAETVLNSESGISISGLIIPDAILQVNQVSVDLEDAVVAYDINLIRDHEKIQPNGEITISIPSEYNACDVFWVKDDGTKENMNAEYADGKYIFTTDHLSVYALVRKSTTLLGDVNGDGKVGIDDATNIQKYMAEMFDFTDNQKELADVNKDGKVGVDDVTLIQKHMAGLSVIE